MIVRCHCRLIRYESLTIASADSGKANEAVLSEGAKVSEHVASYTIDLPCKNGKTVMLSGRRPLPLSRSTGFEIPRAILV